MKEKRSTKETLRLIGKIGSIVSLVLVVFCGVGAFFGLIGVIVSPFVDWAWLRGAFTDMAAQSGNTLNWNVALLNATNAEIVSLQALLNCVVSGVLLFFCRSLFDNIQKAGTPFAEANVRLLIEIGIVSLVQAIALPLIFSIVVNATDTEAIFGFGGGSGASIIVALFVFALSLVFKYGVELQKEADTTL